MKTDNPTFVQVSGAFEGPAARHSENGLPQKRPSASAQSLKKWKVNTAPVSLVAKFETKNAEALPNPLTLDFHPDPWTISCPAGHLYRFDMIRFTIWQNKGTQYALAWKMTSLGWRSLAVERDKTPNILVEIETAAGNLLDSWRIGPQPMPEGGSHMNVYTHTNGRADILSIPALFVKITLGAATWTNC